MFRLVPANCKGRVINLMLEIHLKPIPGNVHSLLSNLVIPLQPVCRVGLGVIRNLRSRETKTQYTQKKAHVQRHSRFLLSRIAHPARLAE